MGLQLLPLGGIQFRPLVAVSYSQSHVTDKLAGSISVKGFTKSQKVFSRLYSEFSFRFIARDICDLALRLLRSSSLMANDLDIKNRGRYQTI